MKKLFALSFVVLCVQLSFAQQDICDLTVNYTGTYQDFVLPDEIYSFSIQAKGGDGGYGKVETFVWNPFGSNFLVNDCLGDGGTGATASATFLVGNGEGQIPPGSLIRTIVGGQGQSDYDDSYVGYGEAGAGGGGGTAVIYTSSQAPWGSDWTVLLVAGGGGGGYASMYAGACAYQENGGGGNSGTDGGDGGGINGGDGGSNGFAGEEGNSCFGKGGGGGGANENGKKYCTYFPEDIGCMSGGAGSNGTSNNNGNYYDGGFGGGIGGGNHSGCYECTNGAYCGFATPCGEFRVGGYGFGGGGAGCVTAAGGGGGYSGGGGGTGGVVVGLEGVIPLNPASGNEGGGGGSYVSSLAVVQNINPGGSSAYPTNGFVTITCGGSQFSECAPDVYLYTQLGESYATANLAPPIVADVCNVQGNALHFDGVDDFIETNSSLDLLSGWTLETWVKRDVTGAQHSLIEKYDCLPGSGGYALRILPDGRAQAYVIDNCGGQDVIGTTVLNTGTWYHIAATFDPGANSLKIYVNGVLENTNNSVTLDPVSSTLPMKLGSRGNDNGTLLQGAMDEVRIWNVVRSQAEIQGIMGCEFTSKASGLEAVYNFNTGIAGANNNGSTSAFDATFSNDGELFNFSLTGPESNWVEGNPWSTLVSNAPLSFPLGSTLVVWTVTDENGTISTCGQNVTVYDPEAPVINCVPEQTVFSEPGLCDPQVILSQPTVTDNGHPTSNALDFDGLDDYVELGNVTETNFGTGDFTIEFWMNATNNPPGTQSLLTPIISKRGECDCVNLWNVVLSSDDGKVYFEAYDSACTSAYFQSTAVSVNDGNWHHIAIRRLNAELSIYVDGFLSTSQTYPVIIDLNNGDPLRFGKSACTYYQGQLDEVRIWDVARSEFEINLNMNAALSPQPGLKILLDLNEGLADGDNTTELTAFDGSGNNNNGTLNNFALIGDNSNWISRFRAGLSITNDSPGVFPIGETIVTWTATDAGGNIATCTQNVVVIDDVSPVIACPSDTTLNTDPGEDFATITILPPAATDNCSELGNALSFDGIDDRVTISNPVDSVFTIEAWIKTSAVSNTGTFAFQGNPILWSDDFGGGNDFTLAILNDKLSFFDGAGDIATDGTTILNDGVWHHIAVVRNGVLDTTILYVDGLPDGSNSCINVELNANPAIVIGGNLIDQHHFNGSIDEVRIWSGALSGAAIQTYMDRSLSSEIGLAASYPFNQGVAGGDNTGLTTASDFSGNGNDGTLSGFGLTGTTSNWVDNSEMTFTNDAPATFPIGTTTVTWTATDPSGNASSCQFDVTVEGALCPADINGDGIVDIQDFIAFNSAFNTVCDGCPEDITGDGVVNIQDFLALNSAFGTICEEGLIVAPTDPQKLFGISPGLEAALSGIDESEIHPELSKLIDELRGIVQVELYPNPNKGEQINLDILRTSELKSDAVLKVMNAIGQQVMSRRITIQGEESRVAVTFDAPLESGLYLLTIVLDGETKALHFVVE